MSATRGLAAGVLGLSLLELAVSNTKAANNAGALFTIAASAIRRLVDPSVPLIPDLRGGGGSVSTGAPIPTGVTPLTTPATTPSVAPSRGLGPSGRKPQP